MGNARHERGGEKIGLDLEPEDYAWTTRKILEIGDLCCQGRVVLFWKGVTADRWMELLWIGRSWESVPYGIYIRWLILMIQRIGLRSNLWYLMLRNNVV